MDDESLADPHICLIGDRSGEFAGHRSKRVTSLLENQSFVDVDV